MYKKEGTTLFVIITETEKLQISSSLYVYNGRKIRYSKTEILLIAINALNFDLYVTFLYILYMEVLNNFCYRRSLYLLCVLCTLSNDHTNVVHNRHLNSLQYSIYHQYLTPHLSVLVTNNTINKYTNIYLFMRRF
jgi:hypothetical protein